MKKILIPIDGSEHAQKAALWVKNFFKDFKNVSVTFLHVSDLPKELMPHSYMMESIIEPTLIEEIINEKKEQAFKSVAGVFEDTEIKTEYVNKVGNPAEVIAQVAATENFDLVVIGSRGLGEIKGILLGSVSDRVAHICKRPVLIVK
ncbi:MULTISPECIES: universal stress protein [Carboxydocella]|uniref:Nucleotide-binding universal stress protein, UspA family n=2 Tax=Carboxydocella TaxID=178898 RepID=A0A1T4LSN1_9FIRM|nr:MULTISPECIES: universal stress protein [Carboxydocella]AVX20594.1 Nucleotide-binding universal stress protein, UspA family [Carboxydocella thermautotrophica]AVX31016.1 Nucleotide-binding universal stress protein, UspA family [Carboxydocella thermautotrophica]SJZ57641.1 Nucleotide-binding universal stress protein, UspA family [Carboxydocella sporoproducens DSM 16521]GAW27916.1 hypothetical protein ULO1_04860 [Carboxydocella sp. ULO1]GAW31521.1 hypothetical protein JDF658_12860 [Carboxydocell